MGSILFSGAGFRLVGAIEEYLDGAVAAARAAQPLLQEGERHALAARPDERHHVEFYCGVAGDQGAVLLGAGANRRQRAFTRQPSRQACPSVSTVGSVSV